jgi:hypothetical protein
MAAERGVQYVFRAANERLRSRMEGLTDRGRRPVICECSDPDCMEILDLSSDEYQSVRDAGHFIVAAGHETPDIETTVDRRSGYFVVSKD